MKNKISRRPEFETLCYARWPDDGSRPKAIWEIPCKKYEVNGAIARHPSQLYEFTMGLLILLILYLADRWAGREQRPVGLMTGLFLTIYFAGRFVVEFFKDFQTPIGYDWGVTMGQILSIVPFLVGVGLLIWVYRHREIIPARK